MTGPFAGRFARAFLMFGVLPLLFIAGVQLFVLSAQTATFFAWTINPPLTAAFLGAGYWSALSAAYLARRRTDWSTTGTSLLASFAATTMLGVATFLHLDKFHLASPLLITRFVTWVWIAVYVVTPPIFLVILIRKFRVGKTAASADDRPGWLHVGYLLQALYGVAVGLALFILPGSVIPSWPWLLTPLTAQVVGTWLTSYGLASAAISSEKDLRNSYGTMSSLLVFCILQLVVIARYSSAIDWSKPLTWMYMLFLLGGMGCAVAALRLERTKLPAVVPAG
jgi:hypothetical protein